jgi:hypothetical protein
MDLELDPETRHRIGTVMMVLGALFTLTVVGMAWGVPLMMWGWDVRRRSEAGFERDPGAAAA